MTAQKTKKSILQKGFTLIELLVVIAILGVLAVGLIASIDPADKIAAASDSRVLSDLGVLARASEAYATNNSASYPLVAADLVTAGELKSVPTNPGYTYTQTARADVSTSSTPTACTTAAKTCLSIVITSPLKSKKYTNAPVPGPYNFWRFESASGKSCPRVDATTTCP